MLHTNIYMPAKSVKGVEEKRPKSDEWRKVIVGKLRDTKDMSSSARV
jgi:hypothetical protein